MKIFNSKSRGVTLIELSIVLAILGVLIVATISGKSLIDISRATSTMQQLRDRSLAFQIFTSTYDCIPGDCIDATTKITGTTVDANGNGNGVINMVSTSALTKNELAFVEEHLVKSRLFNRTLGTVAITAADPTDATTNSLQTILPKTKIPTAYISSVSSAGSFYNIVGALTQTNTTTADIVNHEVLPATILQIIDSKADDGVANTGMVTCHTAYTPTTDGIFDLSTATLQTDYTTNCFVAAN